MVCYEYLFYRFYDWARRWKWDTDPEITALILMVALTGCNILAACQFLDLYGPASFLSNVPKQAHLLFLAVLALGHYLVFLFRGRFTRIVHRFADESSHQRTVRGFAVLAYLIVTLTAPILAAILHGIKLKTL